MQTCHKEFANVDIAILSAAVADYKPKNVAIQKIKKTDNSLEIQLTPTKDILASVGAIKKSQYLVGFALVIVEICTIFGKSSSLFFKTDVFGFWQESS